MRINGLCRFPDGRDWQWGKLSLALVETLAHSQARLTQSPVGSLLLSLGPGARMLVCVLCRSLFPQPVEVLKCLSGGIWYTVAQWFRQWLTVRRGKLSPEASPPSLW